MSYLLCYFQILIICVLIIFFWIDNLLIRHAFRPAASCECDIKLHLCMSKIFYYGIYIKAPHWTTLFLLLLLLCYFALWWSILIYNLSWPPPWKLVSVSAPLQPIEWAMFNRIGEVWLTVGCISFVIFFTFQFAAPIIMVDFPNHVYLAMSSVLLDCLQPISVIWARVKVNGK